MAIIGKLQNITSEMKLQVNEKLVLIVVPDGTLDKAKGHFKTVSKRLNDPTQYDTALYFTSGYYYKSNIKGYLNIGETCPTAEGDVSFKFWNNSGYILLEHYDSDIKKTGYILYVDEHFLNSMQKVIITSKDDGNNAQREEIANSYLSIFSATPKANSASSSAVLSEGLIKRWTQQAKKKEIPIAPYIEQRTNALHKKPDQLTVDSVSPADQPIQAISYQELMKALMALEADISDYDPKANDKAIEEINLSSIQRLSNVSQKLRLDEIAEIAQATSRIKSEKKLALKAFEQMIDSERIKDCQKVEERQDEFNQKLIKRDELKALLKASL